MLLWDLARVLGRGGERGRVVGARIGRLCRASILRVLALSSVGFYGVWIMWITSIQRSILFPRQIAQQDPRAAERVAGLEKIWIDSDQGPVEGWFIPGEGVSPGRPGPAVLFAHGNAELIDDWPEVLSPYRRLGVSLLLPEYRGYGRSAGEPTQEAITRDFQRFYDWLAARPEVDRKRIVFHGRSLGGGAVSALARLRPCAALILQSTFVSVTALARRFLLPGFLVADPFDNERALTGLDLPVLIVHGTLDSFIPFAHARKLRAVAARGELLAYPCDHNDCPPDWEVFFRDVGSFLGRHDLLHGV